MDALDQPMVGSNGKIKPKAQLINHNRHKDKISDEFRLERTLHSRVSSEKQLHDSFERRRQNKDTCDTFTMWNGVQKKGEIASRISGSSHAKSELRSQSTLPYISPKYHKNLKKI